MKMFSVCICSGVFVYMSTCLYVYAYMNLLECAQLFLISPIKNDHEDKFLSSLIDSHPKIYGRPKTHKPLPIISGIGTVSSHNIAKSLFKMLSFLFRTISNSHITNSTK